MMTRTGTALLLTLFPLLAAAQDWRFGVSGEIIHDDNATRGLYAADKQADQIVSVEGAAGRSHLLSPNSGALFRVGARYSHFVDIGDLSHLTLFGRGSLRYQPTLGFGSPWYELAAHGQWLKHGDSALRDGSILSLEASVGRHLTDRVRLVGGAGYDRRSGGGTAGLYDLSTARVWGNFDYRLGVRNTVYGRLSYLTGDHVFNSVTVSGLSGVWEPDPALAGPLGRPADAYRLDASTLLYEVGFNYPLLGGQAVDLSVSSFSSKADSGGLSYSGTQVRAGYLYRFQ
jgi:hypothetical protein